MPIICVHFVGILAPRYYQSFMASACTMAGRSKKSAKFAIKLVIAKRKFVWVPACTKADPQPVITSYVTND